MSLGILTTAAVPHTLPETLRRSTDPHTRMKAAAQDYETTFLNTMFTQMFADLPTEGLGHGGQAEETYRGMLVNEYAKSVSKAGGIGLAKSIYHELVRVQESRGQ